MKVTMIIADEPHAATSVICEKYEIHRTTAHRWRQRGLLPNGVKIGNVWYYPVKQVERRLSRGEQTSGE